MRTILLFLTVFTLFITLQAQNEVELTEIKPFHYVYMEFEDFDHFEDFDEYLHQLKHEIKNQGLSSSIQGNLLAILFNSPIQKTRLDTVVGLGFQISKETSVKIPLKKRQYNFKKIVKMMHTGYLGQIYNVIGPYIEEKSLEVIGPPLVKMIEIPNKDRPDLLRAEFIIPVRKRNKQSQEKNQNIK
jgi:effector-binding domain-containing protein